MNCSKQRHDGGAYRRMCTMIAAPANTAGAIQKAKETKATRPADPSSTMKAYITRMKSEIAKALPIAGKNTLGWKQISASIAVVP